jgi:transposase
LDIHPNSVTNYIKLYQERGIAGLYATHYHGSGSELERHQTSLIEYFTKNPVCTIAHAIKRIKTLTGIERKPTQVRAFMHRHGFKYRKLMAIPGKLDTEKQKQFLEQELQPVIEKAEKRKLNYYFVMQHILSFLLFYVWFGLKLEHF